MLSFRRMPLKACAPSACCYIYNVKACLAHLKSPGNAARFYKIIILGIKPSKTRGTALIFDVHAHFTLHNLLAIHTLRALETAVFSHLGCILQALCSRCEGS
jgi:hypothetical protein